MNKPFKIGDRVYADAFGYGVVIYIDPKNSTFPIRVKFKVNGVIHGYTNDGKYLHTDSFPSLFHEEDHKAYRLNPYNPLSYIVLIIVIIIGIVMFGVVGFWKKIDMRNLFKWD